MSITITDPGLLAQLAAARTTVDVHGPDGEYIGTFQPPLGMPPPGFRIPFSEEELERRRQCKTGRPLKDILRDLEGGGSRLTGSSGHRTPSGTSRLCG
jgi:hypothetical protein